MDKQAANRMIIAAVILGLSFMQGMVTLRDLAVAMHKHDLALSAPVLPPSPTEFGRYSIVMDSEIAIKLDTKTGYTWATTKSSSLAGIVTGAGGMDRWTRLE